VRLALHPNDPPAAISKDNPQIMATFDGWKRLLDIVKSPVNGMTYDPGVCKEMGLDPVEVLRYIGSRDQINHAHYRNVTTQIPYDKYEEVFFDVGEVNMFAVMKEFFNVGYKNIFVSNNGTGKIVFRGAHNSIMLILYSEHPLLTFKFYTMNNLFTSFLLIALTFSCSMNDDAQKKTKFKSLNYLYSISGSKTVAGIHNREPNAAPARWTNEVYSATGKFPGLWSGDFLFQQDNINNRQLMVDEALRQWEKGAIVNIMWHACNPALIEPCGFRGGVLSKLSDEQWKEITTNGTPLNKKWKERVDEVTPFLQFLEDNGVEVLWRPMHEMNQGAFWWGGRPGPDGTLKLYRMLHDYLTKI